MHLEGISPSQWKYFRHWLILIIAAEGLMLIFNHHLMHLYGGIMVLFAGGLLLRMLKFYPGETEPLILDASAVLIAGLYGFLAFVGQDSGWRFVLILTSSAVVMPHFVYIYHEK